MTDEICKHCGVPIKIGANSKFCDHLYYPDNCAVCRNVGKITYSKITEKDIKKILDNLHRDFKITEIEVDGASYRWPMNIHDEDCRSN